MDGKDNYSEPLISTILRTFPDPDILSRRIASAAGRREDQRGGMRAHRAARHPKDATRNGPEQDRAFAELGATGRTGTRGRNARRGPG